MLRRYFKARRDYHGGQYHKLLHLASGVPSPYDKDLERQADKLFPLIRLYDRLYRLLGGR